MVGKQLADRGIRDPRVLDAMRTVPRHEFVPSLSSNPPTKITRCPSAKGKPSRSRISWPRCWNRWRCNRQTASRNWHRLWLRDGIAGAALCRGVLRGASRNPRGRGRAHSATLDYRNVKIRVGDGRRGWAEYAPFDAILVSAATAEIPPALFAQLRDGGRMMVPVGPAFSQELQLIRKVEGQPEVNVLEGCRFVPLVEG